ncbi:response regulator transcription factor [Pseudoxanthomonas sp. JBR18]|uniref:response regulator transcription factor n=1 Tax=Pseudoxanthomonas sp. JBR18 TaxID=2969308 RepID=UPI002305F282|nr:response regulator transcription factor [Pseudoxanthomonas sp. JBR18]WCE06141.1 response regulator transcription factor [Pseudoxanthomonas sp. JBR18]
MHPTPTQLLIADDHPLFREALVRAIERVMPHARVDEADSVETLMALVEAHPGAELLLLDLDIPGAHGFSALAHLRGVRPQLPVVIVSAREDQGTIQRAMALGAAGFIPKSANLSVLDEALDALLAGDEWLPPGITAAPCADAEETALARRVSELTPQQFRVLGMVCQGLLNKQIAWEMGLAPTTVKVHVSAILRKLDVGTRTQAVMLMHRLASDPASPPPVPQDGDED